MGHYDPVVTSTIHQKHTQRWRQELPTPPPPRVKTPLVPLPKPRHQVYREMREEYEGLLLPVSEWTRRNEWRQQQCAAAEDAEMRAARRGAGLAHPVAALG